MPVDASPPPPSAPEPIDSIAEEIPEISAKDALKAQITADPLNPDLHFAFAAACEANKEWELAFAEYRTALTLGVQSPTVDERIRDLAAKLPDRNQLDHNQFFRFRTLMGELNRLEPEGEFSLLDVGGGIGRLSQFLPKSTYCLAEPWVNGISGTDLPFADDSFDYTVSCHVLEHILPVDRDRFLSELARPARKGVVLLNPFEVPGTSIEERLQLFLDLTGADWAAEHLECTLPTVDYVKDWAKSQGFTTSVIPNGTLTTTAAMVFVDYYATIAGKRDDLGRINEFFNTRFCDLLDSAEIPNAYLVTIHLDGKS